MTFSDRRFDGAGVSLADPASNEIRAWCEEISRRVDDDRGISVFARLLQPA